MSAPHRAPSFRDLSPEEAVAVLARNDFGRLAFTMHNRVDVQPLHYVYDDGWLYGRTRAGAKIETLRRNQWVAFEVDEVAGPFDWHSVVAHGGFYLLSPAGTGRPTWDHAVTQLRRLVPQTLTDDDPVPFRTIVFRIAVQELTGRAASTTGHEASPVWDRGAVGAPAERADARPTPRTPVSVPSVTGRKPRSTPPTRD